MSNGTKLLILAVLLAVLGFASYKTFGPQPVASGPPTEAGCPNGTTECPNNCLKRETEGWRSMSVPGHPDTDVWMQYVDSQGNAVAYNQAHIGHVIALVNGKYIDTGVCPVCRGSTRVCKP